MRLTEVISFLYIAQSKFKNAGRGLFTAKSINSGEVFVLDSIATISPEDWQKIQKTKFAADMGLTWLNGEHVIPIGNISYPLSGSDKEAFDSTQQFRNGVFISPFLMANHSEKPNAEEFIDIPARKVGLRAIRFIEAGEEITKRYKNAPSIQPKKLNFDI